MYVCVCISLTCNYRVSFSLLRHSSPWSQHGGDLKVFGAESLCSSSASLPNLTPSVVRNSNVSIMQESKPELPEKNLVEPQLAEQPPITHSGHVCPRSDALFLLCVSSRIKVFSSASTQAPLAVLAGWGSSLPQPAPNFKKTNYCIKPMHPKHKFCRGLRTGAGEGPLPAFGCQNQGLSCSPHHSSCLLALKQGVPRLCRYTPS